MVMKLSLIYLSFVLGTLVKQAATDDSAYIALKFGSTLSDYISFKPDMTIYSSGFSVCSWINKIKTYAGSTWFSYASSNNNNEIWLRDGAHSVNFVHGGISSIRTPTVSLNVWYHFCLCWSYGKADVYYNGVNTGYINTGSNKIETGGNLVLGQDQDSVGGSFEAVQTFNGELQKLNTYSRKLSATEVSKMYSAGRCSDTAEKSISSRALKWEDILKKHRNGNVKNLDACGVEKLKNLEKELADAEAELKKTQAELLTGKTSIEKLSKELNQTMTLLKTSETEVKKMEDELDKLEKELELCSKTQTKLTETETQLTDTSTRLKNTEVLLYTSSFYNKVLTDQLLGNLDTDWDKLEKFKGSALTTGFIEYFKSYFVESKNTTAKAG